MTASAHSCHRKESHQVVRRSLSEWLRISVVLGLVPPTVWFLVLGFAGPDAMKYFFWGPVWRGPWIVIVWPSSIWLLATLGIEDTPRAYLFIGMAILANAMLYALRQARCGL